MINYNKTQNIALTGMFGAIIFLLAFTPLGFIPLPFLRATTLHIPVIIGSLILGPKYGAALGFLFGLASLLVATLTPFPTSFAFSPLIPLPGTDSGSLLALVVAFLPRVLTGIVPWFIYAGLRRIIRLDFINLTAAAALSTLFHTVSVMHLIFLFFGEPWAYARGEALDAVYTAIVGVIAANGVPEAIAAAIIVPAVATAVFAVSRRLVARQS